MIDSVRVDLDTVFPLYLILTDQDEVCDISPGLAAEIGTQCLGCRFHEAFAVSRPLLREPVKPLANFHGQLFLFKTRNGNFAMRGQIIVRPDGSSGSIMLVTPWLTWMQEHRPETSVASSRFPILDAQVELQLYLSSQQLMMNDQQTLLTQLKLANIEALTASSAKSEFINHVSHELRTPLNGVISAIELLGQHELTEDSAQLVSIIHQSSAGLLTVINQILDYSQMAAASEPLHISTFEPARVCQDVMDVLTVEAFRQQVKLILKSKNDSACRISGDAMKIRNVLLRLISNAIKHGGSGYVYISCEVSDPDSDGISQLYIEVQDQGRGIPAEHRSRMFEPFHTVKSTNINCQSSTGLGLVMAKTEVRLMGGEIGLADNDAGPGCSFWFNVPVTIKTSAEQATSAGATQTPAQNFPDATLLLVDDNIINLQLAKIQLQRLGLSVDTANNGNQALTMATKVKYTMILMDIQMPEMSGTETTALIRKLPGYGAIPIVAWTANASASELKKYHKSGIDDILPKPANMLMLQNLVNKWLSSQ